ncbi:MAG: dihydroneopterin aldolase [Bacteroides sp.]|nr:dihydroneopterin aldolase [Bacteroides sp.]
MSRLEMSEFEIILSDLRFYAFHGVMPQETKVGNEFSVTISLRIPYSSGILNDNLNATISYADVYEIVKYEMNTPRKLLETVAAHICKRITDRWSNVKSGNITICKSTPPIEGITGNAKITLFF